MKKLSGILHHGTDKIFNTPKWDVGSLTEANVLPK